MARRTDKMDRQKEKDTEGQREYLHLRLDSCSSSEFREWNKRLQSIAKWMIKVTASVSDLHSMPGTVLASLHGSSNLRNDPIKCVLGDLILDGKCRF